MARNGRKCFLCGRKQQANASYALHKFPKDSKVLGQWKMFCKFRVEDDVSRLMICSLHFKKDDIVKWDAKQLGGRMSLRAGAIPCISKPLKEIYGVTKHLLRNMQSIDSCEPNVDTVEPIECTNSKVSTFSVENTEMGDVDKRIEFVNVKHEPSLECDNDTNLTVEDNEMGDVDRRIEFINVKQEPDWVLDCDNDTNLTVGVDITKVDNVNERTVFVSVEKESNLECDDTNLTIEDTEVSNADERTVFVSIEEQTNLVCDHGPEAGASVTPKRRKFAEPRYVGDLTSSHIQTPQCAERTIRMIQEKFNKKSLQLKLAQQQIRRLKKRLHKLEDLVSDLKKQGMLPQNTATALTVL